MAYGEGSNFGEDDTLRIGDAEQSYTGRMLQRGYGIIEALRANPDSIYNGILADRVDIRPYTNESGEEIELMVVELRVAPKGADLDNLPDRAKAFAGIVKAITASGFTIFPVIDLSGLSIGNAAAAMSLSRSQDIKEVQHLIWKQQYILDSSMQMVIMLGQIVSRAANTDNQLPPVTSSFEDAWANVITKLDNGLFSSSTTES